MADDPKKPEDDEEDEDEFDDEPVDEEDEDEDDDEEDEDDDDEESSRDRSRGRGTSVVGRLLEGVLSVPALMLGQKIGTDSESIVVLFDKVEAVIGPVMTGMLITTAGSMTRMPKGFRDALIAKKVPRPIVNVLNRLFEDVFEGIWAARRMRHAAKDEKLSKEDVAKGFAHAKDKVKKSEENNRRSLMSAMEKMDSAKRRMFMDRMAILTPDERKKFEYYRPLIKEAWLLEQLAETPTNDWFGILESALGAPPKEKPEGKLAGVVGKLKARAAEAVSSEVTAIMNDPKAAMDEMAHGVEQLADGIGTAAASLKAKNDALGNKR